MNIINLAQFFYYIQCDTHEHAVLPVLPSSVHILAALQSQKAVSAYLYCLLALHGVYTCTQQSG